MANQNAINDFLNDFHPSDVQKNILLMLASAHKDESNNQFKLDSMMLMSTRIIELINVMKLNSTNS